MGEVTLRLNGEQADLVRRGIAQGAEDTAKAIASHVGELVDGCFRHDSADRLRSALDYCSGVLSEELAILAQLPWSTEEEAELELVSETEADAIRAALARKAEPGKLTAIDGGAA